jgi:hypothetical protein
MPPPSLPQAARDYADAIRALFPTTPAATSDRAANLVLIDELESRVANLALLSEEFNGAAAADLREAPADWEQIAVRTLPKVQVDLALAHLLLETDADARKTATAAGGQERSVRAADLLDAAERMANPPAPAAPSRAAAGAALDVEDAKEGLVRAVAATFDSVAKRAAEGGKQAMAGVAVQGFAEVADIAGKIGMAGAELLGVAGGVRALVRWARGFVIRAYEAILALFGEGAVQLVSRRLADWVKYLTGDGFEAFVRDSVYRASASEAALKAAINASAAPADRLAATAAKVNALGPAFQRHVSLAGQVMDGMDNYTVFVTTIFDQAKLAVAVIYALIGGYVLIVGADYCDSPWLPFDRVAGVRRVLEAGLS